MISRRTILSLIGLAPVAAMATKLPAAARAMPVHLTTEIVPPLFVDGDMLYNGIPVRMVDLPGAMPEVMKARLARLIARKEMKL